MHDLRYAFRLIRQNWGFSLTVIAILALCIGADTAVLAVVNGAMVRPLPYPQPDRLTQIVVSFLSTARRDSGITSTGRTWEAIRDHATALDAAVFSWGVSGINLGVNGTGVFVKQQRVSAGFFRRSGRAADDRARIQRGGRSRWWTAGGDPEPRDLAEIFSRRPVGAWPRASCCAASLTPWSGSCPPVFAPIPRPISGLRFALRATARAAGRIITSIARLRPDATWQQGSGQLAR